MQVINQMDHFKQSLQSQDGAGNRFNDSPRYDNRPDIRAASIVTEQHSKNKVFNFAEDTLQYGPRQKVLSPRTRQTLREGKVVHGPDHRINLHHVEKNINSRSPPGNKQLTRLHSAKNLVRRVGDEDQALMAHQQDLTEEGVVSSNFHAASMLNNDQDNSQIHSVPPTKTNQRDLPSEQNQKQARRTLMESAKQSLTCQALPIGTSAQRSVNPNANGIQEKISPTKVVKSKELTRIQKSPPASQQKTQIKGEKWFLESGSRSGSSCSQSKTSRDQSPAGVIQLPNLNRRKSKISGTMSAFLEDPGQQILDSSLDQSFNLSQKNYQITGDMQHNQLVYEGVVSQIGESSTDFWKSATSQTSAPIAKLQSERQSQPKEKLEGGLTKQDRQQTMTSKKIKPIQMLTKSLQKEHHDRADLQKNRVEPIEQKLPGYHRAQQSMDVSSIPFKIDKGNQKTQRGTKVYLEKKTNVVSSAHQPEEIKSCLTERAGKAAAASTTSSANQSNIVPPGSSSGQQTRNERSRLNRNHHNHLHQAKPNDSNVSNQTTGGGSTGSRRSQSSQNDLRSGGQKARRKHHPPITELGSAQHQTPKGAYFSISRQLVPSNSSIPPSSCADDKVSSEDEYEYQSMWAAISKSIDQTTESNQKHQRDGDSYGKDVEQLTEYSGYQYLFNQSLCPSNLGQADQNSSFHESQSQASQFGQDLDSSFYESATNSTWAKSERNSYALKSQHSCSTYNKQTGDKKIKTNQQSQQPQSAAQQHSNATAATSAQATYVSGYARRPSTLEESKAVAQATQNSYLHQSVSAANIGQAVPPDEQMSVSSSASSAKKYIGQQKAHRNIKASGGMTSAQASSQQDLSLSAQIQSSSGKTSHQTPSKDHQTMLWQHNTKQQSQTIGEPSSVEKSNTGSSPAPNWHSQFTSKDKMMLTGSFVGHTSSRAQDDGSGKNTGMLQAPDNNAVRAQMSQSVQPTSNRNNTSVPQMGQLSQQALHHNHQAVPMAHHQPASMSARQNQQQQPSFESFPSPSSAQNTHHSQIQVSGFTPTSGAQAQQFMPLVQAPFTMMPLSAAATTIERHYQHPPAQTMFTHYDPSNQGEATYQPYYPQHVQAPPMMQAQKPHFINMTINNTSQLSNMGGAHQHQPQATAPSPTMAAYLAAHQNNPVQNTNLYSQQTVASQDNQSALFELNKHLGEIERFYEAEKVPCPRAEFNTYLDQMRAIGNLYQRHIAQQNLFFHLQQLLKAQLAQQHQRQRSAFDHSRDYSSSSSASKISSSSHHSSVSSQHRSSNQNNLKLALAQAFSDFEGFQTDEERTQFLVQKAQLFAKDKSGFQLLKNKIDEEVFKLAQQDSKRQNQAYNGSKFVGDLFNQLLSPEYSSFHKLMMHQVANFFCQELFRQANKKQLESVLEFIKNDFCKIAADIHGTRALQVLLEDELINKEKRTERVSLLIFEALKNGRIFELSCNVRGNHVLRQCLILLKTDERRSIIYDPVVQHFAQVARDKHGCQVVKDCITTAQGQWKKDLIRVSFESIEILINDEFGNFVIQAILEHFISLSKRKSKIMDVRVSCVYEFIRQNLAKLCKQQYSSRVVEKAVETMPKEQFEKLCIVFMKNSTKKNKLFKDIMLDNYGNYIAPKILERAKYFSLQHQFDYFSKVYRDSIEALKKVKHGRQLMGKMNQISSTPNKTKQPVSNSTAAQTSASSGSGNIQPNQGFQQNHFATNNQ